jgi:hypothetical protein
MPQTDTVRGGCPTETLLHIVAGQWGKPLGRIQYLENHEMTRKEGRKKEGKGKEDIMADRDSHQVPIQAQPQLSGEALKRLVGRCVF